MTAKIEPKPQPKAEYDDRDLLPPPEPMVEWEPRVVLHLPGGKVLVRRAGF